MSSNSLTTSTLSNIKVCYPFPTSISGSWSFESRCWQTSARPSSISFSAVACHMQTSRTSLLTKCYTLNATRRPSTAAFLWMENIPSARTWPSVWPCSMLTATFLTMQPKCGSAYSLSSSPSLMIWWIREKTWQMSIASTSGLQEISHKAIQS